MNPVTRRFQRHAKGGAIIAWETMFALLAAGSSWPPMAELLLKFIRLTNSIVFISLIVEAVVTSTFVTGAGGVGAADGTIFIVPSVFTLNAQY